MSNVYVSRKIKNKLHHFMFCMSVTVNARFVYLIHYFYRFPILVFVSMFLSTLIRI